MKDFTHKLSEGLQMVGAIQSRLERSHRTSSSINLFLAQHGLLNIAVNQASSQCFSQSELN